MQKHNADHHPQYVQKLHILRPLTKPAILRDLSVVCCYHPLLSSTPNSLASYYHYTISLSKNQSLCCPALLSVSAFWIIRIIFNCLNIFICAYRRNKCLQFCLKCTIFNLYSQILLRRLHFCETFMQLAAAEPLSAHSVAL